MRARAQGQDLAADYAEGKKSTATEPAHAVLKVRPENWRAVLPGYQLEWAEGSRAAYHANLDLVANIRWGWNDWAVAVADAELLGRVAYKVYCGLSARRFTTDLQEAHGMGFTSKAIPYDGRVIHAASGAMTRSRPPAPRRRP